MSKIRGQGPFQLNLFVAVAVSSATHKPQPDVEKEFSDTDAIVSQQVKVDNVGEPESSPVH